jgi:coenzyme PQQ synthesis protein D (PqqD)
VRYRVNSPHVISETVGGETIIVNLASGHYFSLQGTAVDVWQGVERGDAAESIVLELEGRYEAGDGEIGSAVQKLLDDFVAAELLVAETNGAGTVAMAPAQNGGQRAPFVAPSFSTFTDMQDIILLDPVHEVDTRGWPHASAGA